MLTNLAHLSWILARQPCVKLPVEPPPTKWAKVQKSAIMWNHIVYASKKKVRINILLTIFFLNRTASKKLAERYLSTSEKTTKTKQLWCDLYIYDSGIIWFSLCTIFPILQVTTLWQMLGKYCWIGRCEAITRCTMYLVVGTWPRWTQCCWGPIAYKMLLPLIFQFFF